MNTKSMHENRDIDILLSMQTNGWSNCLILIDGVTYEFSITHVFNDPYEELMHALTKLINGEDYAAFIWFGEPGGDKIEFFRKEDQKHKITVKFSRFDETIDESERTYKPNIEFEIKIKQLLTLLYLQMKKTSLLLQDKAFAKQMADEFPMQEFITFEKTITQFLVSE